MQIYLFINSLFILCYILSHMNSCIEVSHIKESKLYRRSLSKSQSVYSETKPYLVFLRKKILQLQH